MPKFTYDAITDTGGKTSGKIEADSLESANINLASQGFIPTRVSEEKPGFGTIDRRGY